MASEHIDDLLPSEAARFEEVCRFGQDKLEPIARTVARAFADDPVWMWIYERTEAVDFDTAIVLGRLLVAQSSPVDEIHGFRHFGAVALWVAPAERHTDQMLHASGERLQPHVEQMQAQLGERAALTGNLSHAIDANRPDEPHWYLGILGTDPDRQNQGLGSRVIQTMQARCDRVGLPTFLVSSNPRNYGFYRRHGYVETEEFTAFDSPPLLGFRRDPPHPHAF